MIIWQPGMSLEQLEKEVITTAVRFYGDDKTKTALALGISVKTIYNKLEQYEREGQDRLQAEAKRNEEAESARVQAQGGVHIQSAVENDRAQRSMSVREREKVQEMPSKRASSGSTRNR